jgi:hypothetical protein
LAPETLYTLALNSPSPSKVFRPETGGEVLEKRRIAETELSLVGRHRSNSEENQYRVTRHESRKTSEKKIKKIIVA